jgi:hypothetical protein
MRSRFQKLLGQMRYMFGPYRPPRRPTFLTDNELEIRRAVARDLMGSTQVKPLILVEDQPDYGERRPIDYDQGLPNG